MKTPGKMFSMSAKRFSISQGSRDGDQSYSYESFVSSPIAGLKVYVGGVLGEEDKGAVEPHE